MSDLTPKLGLYIPAPGDGDENGEVWYEQMEANLRALDNALMAVPVASETALGGVKVGPGLAIDEDGVLFVTEVPDPDPGPSGNNFYDISASCPGYLGDGQVLLVMVAVRPFTVSATGHKATGLTLPTAAAGFTCYRIAAGSTIQTLIGTATLNPDGSTTLTGFAETAFASEDRLVIRAPATMDVTLQDAGLTLKVSA